MKKLLLTTCMAAASMGFFAQPSSAAADEPLPQYGDQAPIVLTGRVLNVRDDEFDLNYGTGVITVELDGWEWEESDMSYIQPNETVTVSGFVDDDLFEGREIEAQNIYINNQNVFFYQNESAALPSYYLHPDAGRQTMADGSSISMRGKVSEIDGDEFTVVDAAGMSMKVDTEDMNYNPMDDEGLQKIKVGDRVQVWGTIDDGFFESREIDASSVVTLSQRNRIATETPAAN